jgi:Reverse transcriptase (RNA-dependent DNA polymerase)/Endonuclease-reverse transcriptase
VLYVKDSLRSSEVRLAARCEATVWCEVMLRGHDKLLVGVVYRSPNSTVEHNDLFMRMISEAANRETTHLCIMGDFNYPGIDWETGTASGSEQERVFVGRLADLFLWQHIKQPTRYRVGQTAHILDLVMTTEEGMIQGIEYTDPIGRSDHVVLGWTFQCYAEVLVSRVRKYVYDKGDYEGMRSVLGSVDWNEALSGKSVGEQWDTVCGRIRSGVNRFIPCKKSNVSGIGHRRPLWMNDRVLIKVKKKRAAYERYMQTGEGGDYLEFARARNAAKAETRRAVREYEKEVARLAKKNPKAFYRYVNSKMKIRTTVADLKAEDGSLLHENGDKAEKFSQFFSSVFTKEEQHSIPKLEDNENIKELRNIEIEDDEVYELLRRLQPEKSPGPDGVHPRVLRECAAQLAAPLAIVFRTSLKEGKLPEAWKEADITPVFKKGARSDVGNYRPISLTSVCSKVMERIVRSRLLGHMIGNRLLSDYQHGFICGRSCTTQLLRVVDKWTEVLDQGGSVDAVYLDFAKAFDTVPHQRLLAKLAGYGIKGPVMNWIEDFLVGRRQRVGVGGTFSGWMQVMSGVPQGSVLGPVLFVCYINDMPDTVRSFLYMYADDTKMFRRIDSDLDRIALQQDLNRLAEWAQKWQLRFNVGKCHIMHIGGKGVSGQYVMKTETFGEQILEETSQEKDLGIWITNTLKPSTHIAHAVNKANQLLGLIRRSFTYLDGVLMKNLFTSVIRPHLEYGNVVWHPYLQKDIEALEKVQHRATKMIPGLAKMTYTERLERLDLPTLVYRRQRGDAIEVYKYLHGCYGTDCGELLPLHVSAGTETRGHSLKLKKRDCRGLLRSKVLGYRVVGMWNDLPEEIISAPTVNCFKGRFDRHCRGNRFSMEWTLGRGGLEKGHFS